MRHGEHQRHERYGRFRGEEHRYAGAQTFRRGRAIEFLQRLNIKRATLVKQLEQSELQGIHQVISGELKAIDLVRNEFSDLFDLHEISDAERENKPNESVEEAGSSKREQTDRE